MLPKPDACKSCPLWGDGRGFVPDEPRSASPVAILAQNPGADEEYGRQIVGWAGKRDPLYEPTSPRPLIGATGYMLMNTYLPLAGLSRDTVSLHNLIKCRWKHTNTLPTGDLYEEAVAHCTKHHLHIPEGVKVIVAQGAHAWRFTQGEGYSITDWRGFCGPHAYQDRPVYGTIHVADLLRGPHERFIARFDWKRLKRLVSGEWPRALPHSIIACPSNRADFIRIMDEALHQPEIMVDTEYVPDKQLLTHVGAAWRVGDTVHGFQLEWLRGSATAVERAIFARYWRQLCDRVPMGFWNAKADLPILEANLHAVPRIIEDPMQAHACLWPDMNHDLEFVASIYGKYNKLKHLSKQDILAYHWGDCIELVWIWEQLKEELRNDPQVEQKYRQQNLKLIPIILEAEAHGIRVNQAHITAALPSYRALTDDAACLAGAYCGFPVSLGSPGQLLSVLSASEGLELRSVDQDSIAAARTKVLPFDADYEEEHGFSTDYLMQRVEEGAHPLLELRVMYATAQQVMSHYLEPLRGVARCHPSINFHTQAGGRHSTTRPPLATLPGDLRNLVLPDPGEVWIGWDWDQQEPRIQRAESGSHVLGRAFDEGEDIHTTFVCQLYGWPYPTNRRDPHSDPLDGEWRDRVGWQGKDDARRVFAKTTRYEINYGGDGTQAAKKAIRMGVMPEVAKRAATVLLQSDPELATWFRKVEKQVMETHIVRSWDGGRRVFYWVDASMPGMVAEMKRQARNFPPQGGGSGLYNLTIVEITEKVPEVKFVYGMHDSQWWRTDARDWLKPYLRIREIVTQARLINGMAVPFPASFKVMFEDGRVEKVVHE